MIVQMGVIIGVIENHSVSTTTISTAALVDYGGVSTRLGNKADDVINLAATQKQIDDPIGRHHHVAAAELSADRGVKEFSVHSVKAQFLDHAGS